MIYIRHGQKSYRNGEAVNFSLDPGLTLEGLVTCRNKFIQLIEHYGVPCKIVSSPYLRARETAQIAQEVIYEYTGIFINITYDRFLGEYLGNQAHLDMSQCLRPETLAHNPIPSETWKQYNNRIHTYIRNVRGSGWYITHGLIIQSIGTLIGHKIPYPAELEGIRIDHSLITYL